jgi:hypothetical protein
VFEIIACHKIATFTEMVDMASIAERSVKEVTAEYAQRKWSASQPTYPAKRQATGSSSGAAVKRNPLPSVSEFKACMYKCGKSHFGECRIATGGCFRCGKLVTLLKIVL